MKWIILQRMISPAVFKLTKQSFVNSYLGLCTSTLFKSYSPGFKRFIRLWVESFQTAENWSTHSPKIQKPNTPFLHFYIESVAKNKKHKAGKVLFKTCETDKHVTYNRHHVLFTQQPPGHWRSPGEITERSGGCWGTQ